MCSPLTGWTRLDITKSVGMSKPKVLVIPTHRYYKIKEDPPTLPFFMHSAI